MKRILVFVTLLLLTGCMDGSFENVTIDQAKEMIDLEEVVVLDVRTTEEFKSGHIPGSKLVPLQVLEGVSEELDKDKSYLIVCRSGNRSQQAAEILSGKGFKKVYNMKDGMNEWKYEIEQ